MKESLLDHLERWWKTQTEVERLLAANTDPKMVTISVEEWHEIERLIAALQAKL